MWVFLNDRFVPKEEAVVSVFDHGFLYGDGVYETLRSYGTRIFMRDQHLARLRRSAEAIGLDDSHPGLAMAGATPRSDAPQRRRQRTDRCLSPNYRVARRRRDRPGSRPLPARPPWSSWRSRSTASPPTLSRDGVSLTVANTRRNLPEALSPQIKSTNFLNNILAKREAIAAGTFDSLFLNWNDELTECTVSNLFFVSGKTLHTPALDCGILDGITRAIVMTLAEEEGLPVREGRYQLADLRRSGRMLSDQYQHGSHAGLSSRFISHRRWAPRPPDPSIADAICRQPNAISRTVSITNIPIHIHCINWIRLHNGMSHGTEFFDRSEGQTATVETSERTPHTPEPQSR